MFRLLWLYAALYDLTGIGARGPKYPFPEAWRLGLGQIALASPFAVVGGGSETTGVPGDHLGAHVQDTNSVLYNAKTVTLKAL